MLLLLGFSRSIFIATYKYIDPLHVNTIRIFLIWGRRHHALPIGMLQFSMDSINSYSIIHPNLTTTSSNNHTLHPASTTGVKEEDGAEYKQHRATNSVLNANAADTSIRHVTNVNETKAVKQRIKIQNNQRGTQSSIIHEIKLISNKVSESTPAQSDLSP